MGPKKAGSKAEVQSPLIIVHLVVGQGFSGSVCRALRDISRQNKWRLQVTPIVVKPQAGWVLPHWKNRIAERLLRISSWLERAMFTPFALPNANKLGCSTLAPSHEEEPPDLVREVWVADTASPVDELLRISGGKEVFVYSGRDNHSGEIRESSFAAISDERAVHSYELTRHGQKGSAVIWHGSVPCSKSIGVTEHLTGRHVALAILRSIQRIPQKSSETRIGARHDGEVELVPDLRFAVTYIGQIFEFILTAVRRRIRGDTGHWALALGAASSWAHVRNSDFNVKDIGEASGSFYADPHIVTVNRNSFVFAEKYDAESKKGHIVAFQVESKELTPLGPVLIEPFHLSFPFVFRNRGMVYMVPESQEAHQIRLYRAADFPHTWELAAVPVAGVSAVDSVVFRREGYWWLMTSIDSSGSGSHGSESHLYFSRQLEAGDWTPHPMNPVITDSMRGRNAGLISDSGKCFRVFQEPGFGSYGNRVGISELTRIDLEAYAETNPIWISNSKASSMPRIHTLSAAGKLVAIDFWLEHGKVTEPTSGNSKSTVPAFGDGLLLSRDSQI